MIGGRCAMGHFFARIETSSSGVFPFFLFLFKSLPKDSIVWQGPCSIESQEEGGGAGRIVRDGGGRRGPEAPGRAFPAGGFNRFGSRDRSDSAPVYSRERGDFSTGQPDHRLPASSCSNSSNRGRSAGGNSSSAISSRVNQPTSSTSSGRGWPEWRWQWYSIISRCTDL